MSQSARIVRIVVHWLAGRSRGDVLEPSERRVAVEASGRADAVLYWG
jgi:hypothetical protein